MLPLRGRRITKVPLSEGNLLYDKDMIDDPTQEFYESHAAEYEEHTRPLQPTDFLQRFLQTLSPKANILDIGCAFGRDSLCFVEKGFSVTGIDSSSALLDRARHLVPAATFLRMDMRALSFPSESFQGIWASMSLLHLHKTDVPLVLHSIYSLLLPGGTFAMSVKCGEGEGVVMDRRYGGAQKYVAYFSEREIRQSLKSVGFFVEWLGLQGKQLPYQDRPVLEVVARKVPEDSVTFS